MKNIVEYKDEHKTACEEYVSNLPSGAITHQIDCREVMHDGLGHKSEYILATEGSRSKGFYFVRSRMVKADNLVIVHSQDKA